METDQVRATYAWVRGLSMRSGVRVGALLHAMLEIHDETPFQFMLTLAPDVQTELLFAAGRDRFPELMGVMWHHGRLTIKLSRAVESRVCDVVNDLTSYLQHDHKRDQLHTLLRLGAECGVSPRGVLGMVRERLHAMWRKSAQDPGFRQHLRGVRSVFERFALWHRIGFDFGAW